MMELKIGNHKFVAFNDVTINQRFDSVADTFSFDMYFDPAAQNIRDLFKPASFLSCSISYGGVLLLEGIILGSVLSDAGDPPRTWVKISGYSKTGILEDCGILNTDTTVDPNGVSITSTPSQFVNMNLKEIAENICSMFPINVIVDDSIAEEVNSVYSRVEMKVDESIKEFLDKLCKHKNIVLSHTPKGDLLITRAKTNKLLTTKTTLVKVNTVSIDPTIEGSPDTVTTQTTTQSNDRPTLFDFTASNKGSAWTEMRLNVNGQNMHSVIQVVGQFDGSQNASDALQYNPYVSSPAGTHNALRYRRYISKAKSEADDTPVTARALLGDELKNITLEIDIPDIVLNHHVATPNQMVTVINPSLFLFNRTKWFIRETVLRGNESKNWGTLICVLPECYNTDEVKNIFG